MPGPELVPRDGLSFEIPATVDMRVPGVVYASPALLPDDDGATLQQVANVATLPGIVEASYAMPDLHYGYGFCIGGVAATDVERGGVVSPGGVGFDISCGVRLLATPVRFDELAPAALEALMDRLAARIPRGTGPGGIWRLDAPEDLERLLVEGSAFAVESGYGEAEDLARTEDEGRLPGADPTEVSDRARKRGLNQIGSLGAGNHFLEVQTVEEVLDETAAEAFGVAAGQLTVMLHCGSRGLGHQVCTDHVSALQNALGRYGISLPDRQLACAPVESPEGQAYLGAMAAAANYGRANRQVLAWGAQQAFDEALDAGALRHVYDVSHNMAKLEEHTVGGAAKQLCVHRKGATRSLPPGHRDLPGDLRAVGQPVIVPGSMGTSSWLLAGDEGLAFASTCHGAGRAESRAQARKHHVGKTLAAELHDRGILVRALTDRGLAEEAPEAYKNVDEVVRVCDEAGLSRRVARLRPVGVVKG